MGQGEGVLVQVRRLEVAVGRDERGLDGGERDARDLLVERARGGLLPLEVEGGVDVAQDGPDARAVADDHRRAEQRGAAHEPLGRADQLHAPARVDAVGARAVLARHLADARVDAEALERAREPFPLVAKRSWVPVAGSSSAHTTSIPIESAW